MDQELFDTAFRKMMAETSNRMVVMAFVESFGLNVSTLRNDSHLTAHAIGGQDAARWWQANIRDLCPEREAQMIKEAKKRFNDSQKPQTENDDD